MTRALGAPLTDDERTAFLAACRALVGTKFRHRGRSGRSVDCAGVPVVALQSIGRSVRDLAAYGKFPNRDGLREMLVANLGPPVPGLQPGDIALMRMRGEPRHVGVVAEFAGRLTLIHASSDFGKVVEHSLLASPWFDNIVEVYRP
jgi:hypothetical protein